MPSRRIHQAHDLGRSEALRRVRRLLRGVADDFAGTAGAVRSGWSADIASFSFRAMGFPVSGTTIVNESAVLLSYSLPIVALPVAGRVDTLLRDRLRVAFAEPTAPTAPTGYTPPTAPDQSASQRPDL